MLCNQSFAGYAIKSVEVHLKSLQNEKLAMRADISLKAAKTKETKINSNQTMFQINHHYYSIIRS